MNSSCVTSHVHERGRTVRMPHGTSILMPMMLNSTSCTVRSQLDAVACMCTCLLRNSAIVASRCTCVAEEKSCMMVRVHESHTVTQWHTTARKCVLLRVVIATHAHRVARQTPQAAVFQWHARHLPVRLSCSSIADVNGTGVRVTAR